MSHKKCKTSIISSITVVAFSCQLQPLLFTSQRYQCRQHQHQVENHSCHHSRPVLLHSYSCSFSTSLVNRHHDISPVRNLSKFLTSIFQSYESTTSTGFLGSSGLSNKQSRSSSYNRFHSTSMQAARDTCSSTTASIQPHIVIAGGGPGGLYTAVRLAQLPWTRLTRPRITILDPSNRFLFLPLLYDLLTGDLAIDDVAPKYETLLQSVARKTTALKSSPTAPSYDEIIKSLLHMQSKLVKLDVEKKLVTAVSSQGYEQQLPYDRLVLALGAQSETSLVPGVDKYALTFHSLKDAQIARDRLSQLRAQANAISSSSKPTGKRVVIIGGGYIGVELACLTTQILNGPLYKVGEANHSPVEVCILHSKEYLLSNSKKFNRSNAISTLESLNVKIIYNCTVQAVNQSSVEYKVKNSPDTTVVLDSDITFWTPGTRPNKVLDSLTQLPKTNSMAVQTNKFLSVPGFPDIFALGDCAQCVDVATRSATPTTAQAAMQQAEYVAWNCWQSIVQSRQMLSYRYTDLGEILYLGSKRASISAASIEKNAPGLIQVDGAVGASMRRAIYAIRMPTPEQRGSVFGRVTTDAISDTLSKLFPF